MDVDFSHVFADLIDSLWNVRATHMHLDIHPSHAHAHASPTDRRYASAFINTLWLGIDASARAEDGPAQTVQVVYDLDASSVVDFSSGAAAANPDFAAVKAWYVRTFLFFYTTTVNE